MAPHDAAAQQQRGMRRELRAVMTVLLVAWVVGLVLRRPGTATISLFHIVLAVVLLLPVPH